MDYDPNKNALHTDGTSGSLIRGSGQMFIRALKEIAELPDVSAKITQDWNILKKWLGCHSKELTRLDYQNIALAWQSYMATCESPSLALEESFADAKRSAQEENWQLVKIPNDVKGVFDRTLATEAEITEKQNQTTRPNLDKLKPHLIEYARKKHDIPFAERLKRMIFKAHYRQQDAIEFMRFLDQVDPSLRSKPPKTNNTSTPLGEMTERLDKRLRAAGHVVNHIETTDDNTLQATFIPKHAVPKKHQNMFKDVLNALDALKTEYNANDPYKQIAMDHTFKAAEQSIKADKKDIINDKRDPYEIALTALWNISNEELSVGHNHIYRGVLSGTGQGYLFVFKKTVSILLERGIIDENEAQENRKMIQKNIKNAG